MTVAELESQSHKISELLEIFAQHNPDRQVFIRIGSKTHTIDQIRVDRFTGNLILADK